MEQLGLLLQPVVLGPEHLVLGVWYLKLRDLRIQTLDLTLQAAVLFVEQLKLRVGLWLDHPKLRGLRMQPRDLFLQAAVLSLEPL